MPESLLQHLLPDFFGALWEPLLLHTVAGLAEEGKVRGEGHEGGDLKGCSAKAAQRMLHGVMHASHMQVVVWFALPVWAHNDMPPTPA